MISATLHRFPIEASSRPVERNEDNEFLFDWPLSPEAQKEIEEMERGQRHARIELLRRHFIIR
ncbi:MAG TPA: hypothetical protein VGE23_02885 [Candidatus Paceibacterota bacterium]